MSTFAVSIPNEGNISRVDFDNGMVLPCLQEQSR